MLMSCWSMKSSNRPSFSAILDWLRIIKDDLQNSDANSSNVYFKQDFNDFKVIPLMIHL